MTPLDFGKDLLPRDNREARLHRKSLPFTQERAASQLVPEAGGGPSLASYIPSAIIPTEKRAAALLIGGPPAWSRRLRRIDTLTDAALEEIEAAWRTLAEACRGKPTSFARVWREYAASFDFSQVNEQIRRHNEHFPAEANLAMDLKTGEFIGLGGGDYRKQPLDEKWVLRKFPPDLLAALG